MQSAETPNFLKIFAAHRECCREMLELSREQRQLIERDDYTELLAVLGKKQKQLKRLDEFSKHRPQIRSLWRAHRDGLHEDVREECEELLLQTETDLAELVSQERECTDRLQSRRIDLHGELKNISQGERVSEAYRETLAPATHRRIDVGT